MIEIQRKLDAHMTFGDVPEESTFIDREGDIGYKTVINDYNAIVICESGMFPYEYGDDDPVRLVDVQITVKEQV